MLWCWQKIVQQTAILGYRYNGGALDQIDWYQVTTTEDGNLNVTLDIEPSSYFNLSIYDSNGVTSFWAQLQLLI